jgi:hypothetical protein
VLGQGTSLGEEGRSVHTTVCACSSASEPRFGASTWRREITARKEGSVSAENHDDVEPMVMGRGLGLRARGEDAQAGGTKVWMPLIEVV